METQTVINILLAVASLGGLALAVHNSVQHFREQTPRIKVRAWPSAPRKVSRSRVGRDLWVEVRNVGLVPVGLVSVGWFDPKTRKNGGFRPYHLLDELLAPGAVKRFVAVQGAKEIPAQLLSDGFLEIHTGTRVFIKNGEEFPAAGESEEDAV